MYMDKPCRISLITSFMKNLHLLEPPILLNIAALDANQLFLLLFVSSEVPNTSRALQEAAAFHLSTKIDSAKIDHIIKTFQLLTPTGKPNQPYILGRPRNLAPEAVKLLKSCLAQSLPILASSLKGSLYLSLDKLEVVLRYFDCNREEIPSQPLLELLSLQLTKQKSLADYELFLRVYVLFAELDLRSTALADHFNKTFYHIVQTDLEKSIQVLKLESTNSAPTSKFLAAEWIQNDAREANEVILEHSFRRILRYIWAFFKFSYRSGSTKFIDKRLLADMIKALNQTVISSN
jgi:hypothetical protein